jgi:hypothetical protein
MFELCVEGNSYSPNLHVFPPIRRDRAVSTNQKRQNSFHQSEEAQYECHIIVQICKNEKGIIITWQFPTNQKTQNFTWLDSFLPVRRGSECHMTMHFSTHQKRFRIPQDCTVSYKSDNVEESQDCTVIYCIHAKMLNNLVGAGIFLPFSKCSVMSRD